MKNHCKCKQLKDIRSKKCKICYLKNIKGKNHPNWKGGKPKCIDCGKRLSNNGYRYCKKCYLTKHFGLKDGKWLKNYYCIDCKKKLIRYKAKRCKSCETKRKHKVGIINVKGRNNPNWINGISKSLYPSKFNRELKKYILKRDNCICQLCNRTQKSEIGEFNSKLPIHHIDYNKKNCNKDNLITLCHRCNTKVNSNRNYWYVYFIYIMEEK